ncbi:glycosyltransferase [Neorhodopirellula lusitana]|uniref:glycosyltransferase n=1 Tax=Neorhodopirellula lusitana TaxID=445327 RepID=UPI003850696A
MNDTTPQMEDVAKFYDSFCSKLVDDYAFGNRRIEQAIRFALSSLPSDAASVLDVGFGLGWSAQEMLRHNASVLIKGIDLSQSLATTASKLCPSPRAKFVRQDVLRWVPEAGEKYDAVLMLDVYEHIPAEARRLFNEKLKSVIHPGSVILLTCPSPAHQNYLREHNPSGLQPVDEDITKKIAGELAKDVGLEVIKFSSQSVWNDCDYNHIVIAAREYSPPEQRDIRIQTVEERRDLLEENLKLRVHAPGVSSAVRDASRVCVATPNSNAYSETFISKHIQDLPFDVFVLHGDMLPPSKNSRWERRCRRILFRALRKMGGIKVQVNWEKRVRIRWLKENRIELVLAEYGPTACTLMSAAKEANIPIVAHFHGFDAYRHDIVEQHEAKYPQLFKQVAGVVAVSKHMFTQLRQLGCEKDKLHYIAYSVGPEFSEKPITQRPSRRFLAVGRFVGKKAPDLTIRAFALFSQKHPDVKLEMVGDGPLLEECQQLACELGVEDNVIFHGAKASDWISEKMSDSLAFVQHSLRPKDGDSEGTPVAILEAQASGVPVIATIHAGISDVVVDGVTGKLTPERDVTAMADSMDKIASLTDQDMLRMRQDARERWISYFSEKDTIDKLASLITSVLQAR